MTRGGGRTILNYFKIASIWRRMKGWSLGREEQFKIIGALLFKGDRGSEHGHYSKI